MPRGWKKPDRGHLRICFAERKATADAIRRETHRHQHNSKNKRNFTRPKRVCVNEFRLLGGVIDAHASSPAQTISSSPSAAARQTRAIKPAPSNPALRSSTDRRTYRITRPTSTENQATLPPNDRSGGNHSRRLQVAFAAMASLSIRPIGGFLLVGAILCWFVLKRGDAQGARSTQRTSPIKIGRHAVLQGV